MMHSNGWCMPRDEFMSAHAAIAHAKNTESCCFLVTHQSCPSEQGVEERLGQGGECFEYATGDQWMGGWEITST